MVSEVKRQIANSFHKQTSAQTTLKKPLQQLQIVNVGTCRQNDLQPTKKKSNASAPAVSNLNKTLQGFTKSIGEVQLQMDNKSSKHIGHSVQVKRRLDFPEQLMNAEHCQKTCVEKVFQVYIQLVISVLMYTILTLLIHYTHYAQFIIK
jgi:hypothetical protein